MAKAGTFPTQFAVQDRNQFPAMTAHRGTAGTADVVRVVADEFGNMRAAISAAKESLQSHFESATGWGTTLADNLAVNAEHRGPGTYSLNFDKITGGTTSMISKTVTAFDASQYSSNALGFMHAYVSDLTNVESVFVRIGDDSSNYGEWKFADTLLSNGWNHLQAVVSEPTSQVGNGYHLNAITWIAFGVNFDAAANTLTDIMTGGWELKRVLETSTSVSSDVTVNTAWVGIKDQNSNTRADVEGGATYNYLVTRNTDGANFTPAGDNNARAIFVQAGTNTMGSVSAVGVVHNAGTIAALPDPLGSVVVTAGTVSLALDTGTITTGSLANIGVVHNAGSIAALPDLPGGTLDLLTGAGTLGSVSNVAVVHNAGTVAQLPDLPGGTVDLVSNSVYNTIPTGSIVASSHTLGTGGGTQVGTLLAPVGAGTNVWLTGLSIVGRSGTADCGIANNVAGTTGAGVYARGKFNPGGGIARDFNPPINVGANGTIAYFIVDAGTVDFTINYIVST